MKHVIIDKVREGVQIFDPAEPTYLATDWSKEGIRFFLLQKHCRCDAELPNCCADGWRLTFAGSHFTHPAESRYVPIEGEALAITYALDKATYFVLGCDNLIVAMDHKPLIPSSATGRSRTSETHASST